MAAKTALAPAQDEQALAAAVNALSEAANAMPDPSEWSQLAEPVAMASKTAVGSIRVNVLDSTHPNIRQRAEACLGVNAKRVAAKAGSQAKRARVDYYWLVQPVVSVPQSERFEKALAKYAKYRPFAGEIPFADEASPVGQVTCRTGVPTYYRNVDDGEPIACAQGDEGAYLGIRYSVRPLEQRGDAARLPGTV